jgi:hypothetical protein
VASGTWLRLSPYLRTRDPVMCQEDRTSRCPTLVGR